MLPLGRSHLVNESDLFLPWVVQVRRALEVFLTPIPRRQHPITVGEDDGRIHSGYAVLPRKRARRDDEEPVRLRLRALTPVRTQVVHNTISLQPPRIIRNILRVLLLLVIVHPRLAFGCVYRRKECSPCAGTDA